MKSEMTEQARATGACGMTTAEAVELAKQLLDADMYNGGVYGAAMNLAAYVIERNKAVRPDMSYIAPRCICEALVRPHHKFCSGCGLPLDWGHA